MNIGIGKVANWIWFYVYNVPESQSGDTSVQKTHDIKIIFILDIANKIEAGQIDVTSVTQLNKKVDNENRLMKVQMANLRISKEETVDQC